MSSFAQQSTVGKIRDLYKDSYRLNRVVMADGFKSDNWFSEIFYFLLWLHFDIFRTPSVVCLALPRYKMTIRALILLLTVALPLASPYHCNIISKSRLRTEVSLPK